MKRIFGIILRSLTILFAISALLYGSIFISIDLSGTINFPTIEAAEEARRSQVATSIPFIILGIVLLILLVIYYVIRFRKKNIKRSQLYEIIIALIGGILFLGSLIVGIQESQIILIVCIIPSLFLVIYGIYKIIAYRKKVLKKNNQSDAE